jgi:hypothetical protein
VRAEPAPSRTAGSTRCVSGVPKCQAVSRQHIPSREYPNSDKVKASRAYIAGLGTSGVLIASFLLLFMVGSAIVAFQGAPGRANNDGLDRLDVSHTAGQSPVASRAPLSDDRRASDASAHRGHRGRRAAAPRAGRARTGARPAGTARGRDGERAAGVLHGGAAGGSDRGGGAATVGESGAESGGGRGGRDGAGRGTPGLPVQLPEVDTAPRAPTPGDVTSGLGNAVEQTTSGLGQTVGGVAPQLEEPVAQTGEALGGVVEQTGPVLDGTVGQVNGTVDNVTGAVGGVTDRVRESAGGLLGGAP